MEKKYKYCSLNGIIGRFVDQFIGELYEPGIGWVEDKDRRILGTMIGYGDWSTSDYDDISEEYAMKEIKRQEEAWAQRSGKGK